MIPALLISNFYIFSIKSRFLLKELLIYAGLFIVLVISGNLDFFSVSSDLNETKILYWTIIAMLFIKKMKKDEITLELIITILLSLLITKTEFFFLHNIESATTFYILSSVLLIVNICLVRIFYNKPLSTVFLGQVAFVLSLLVIFLKFYIAVEDYTQVIFHRMLMVLPVLASLIYIGIILYKYFIEYNQNEKINNEIGFRNIEVSSDDISSETEDEFKKLIEEIKISLEKPDYKSEIIDKISKNEANFQKKSSILDGERYHSDPTISAILHKIKKDCIKENINFNIENVDYHCKLPYSSSETSIILFNLLNNSMEAIEAKRLSASNREDRHQIELSIKEDGKYIVLSVKDDGKLMTKKQQKRLFKIRFSTKITSKFEIRGFGLYNIKKILDKYKDLINVDQNNEFKEFTIYIDKESKGAANG